MEKISDIMCESRILEIASADSKPEFNIDNDPNIDMAELTKDDPNPMFVNVEVLRTGISKTNRRLYDSQIVRQVGTMIPGTIGYLGHPDPNKTSFEFRDPQNIYVGSKVEEMQDGSVRAIGKAYIFKSSPLREWLPKSIIGGKPLTVSINGSGDVMRDTINDIIHVKSLNQLDSIDWANPGTEGVGSAQAINIVHEMQDDKGGEGKMADVTVRTPELIKSVTIAELQAYNGETVNAIVRGVTIAEFQEKNPKVYEAIKESGATTELTLKVDGKDTSVKLTEMQSLVDTKDAKIAELQNAIETAKITEYKNKKIVELVPENYREKVSGRIAGKTEAEIDASITAEVAYIKEMMGEGGFDNLPKGNGAKATYDETAKQVMTMFGVKVEDKK